MLVPAFNFLPQGRSGHQASDSNRIGPVVTKLAEPMTKFSGETSIELAVSKIVALKKRAAPTGVTTGLWFAQVVPLEVFFK